MKIYPDTSFLVSWLYAPDINHEQAKIYFRRYANEEWIISPWAEFETINTLRQLCVRNPGPKPAQVETARRFFKHLFGSGPLKRQAVDWLDALTDCHQISAAFATQHPCRAADVLHVAILEQINPDIFISGDRDQVTLAKARGYKALYFC